MVAFLPVIFLACRNRYRQPVFLGRQRTRSVRRYGAGRVIGPVEVEHYSTVGNGISLQKSAARIGVGLLRRIVEDEEQAFGWIVAQVCQRYFLTINLEFRLAGNGCGRNVAQN